MVSAAAQAGSDGPQRIRDVVQQAVDRGVMPGAVVLVAHGGKVVFEEAFGWADLEARRRQRTDDYFFLASTSKPLTATAILRLVDQGKLKLDEPAANWMTQLAGARLATGEPVRSPTLREMLSHTAGMYGGATATEPQQRLLWNFAGSLAKTAPEIAGQPFVYRPGEGFSYGGASITVSGRIAELVSGQEFDEVMRQQILLPLGMTETFFRTDQEFQNRFSVLYQDGRRRATFQPTALPGSFVLPSGGILSTARDLATFVQFHLNGCKGVSEKILSESLCTEMRRDQTGGKPMDFRLGKLRQNSAGIGNSEGYGLGWLLDEIGPDRRARVFSHGGAFGTLIWGDSQADLAIILLTHVPLSQVADVWDEVIRISRSQWGATATSPESDREEGSETARSYEVETERITWHDASRRRDIPVKIFGPSPAQTKGPLPLVVFSHGLGESSDAFDFLGNAWARQGYLAVFLTHPGADHDSLKKYGMPKNQAENFDHRDKDLRFATGHALSGKTASRLLDGRVDTQRLGVAGQCAGSTTALYAAGLNINRPDSPRHSNPDGRFKTAIALSPQMPFDVMLAGTRLAANLDRFEGGSRELHKDSWETIRVPTLVVTGGRDFSYFPSVRQDPTLVRMAYEGLPAGENYLVELAGAEHHAFTDSEPWYPAGSRDPRHHEMIAEATTLFLDAYLSGETEAKRRLKEGDLEKSSGGEILQEDKTEGAAPPRPPRREGTGVTPAPLPQAAPGERTENLLRLFDRNRDGMLTRSEIPQQAERLQRAFDMIDANRDGKLSKGELTETFGRIGHFSGRTPAPAPEKSFPVVTLTPGPYSVTSIEQLTLNDPKQRKRLSVRVAYPAEKGRYPLIAFSHSLGRSRDSYNDLAAYWASHGYVCILPDHSDSPNVWGGPHKGEAMDVRGRADDLAFLLDSLSEIGRVSPPLRERIDTGRIGVGGHYIGAFAASLLAGATWNPPSGDERTPRDKRIRASLWISPQGTGQGMGRDSWANVSGAFLIVTGSADASPRTGNPAEWRTEPYRFSPPGDKYLVFIEGYPTLRGERGAEISYDELIGEANKSYVYQATLNFWNAYLKEDAQARSRLKSGELEKLSGGAVTVSYK